MFKSLIRFGLVALAAAAVVYGCGENNDSPTSPATPQPVAARVQVECGEVTYLSALSPVLPVWKDSVEAWLADSLLDDTPVWTEESTVGGYLNALVPVLQQWEPAINDEYGSALLDTVADFDDATTPRQEYLMDLSALLVSWKTAMESAREMSFLPDVPMFQPDEFAPMIMCVTDTTISCADTNGVAVEYEIGTIDDCDPMPVVTCDPPSGSTFMIGTTEVTCTAVDSSGNMSQCTFNVVVEAATPPIITCPADTTVECTGGEGTIVEFEVMASSECSDTVTVVCEPPSGTAFAVGTTMVTCTATDEFGNTAECTFNVTVEDTEPPMISCPADTTLECTGDGGAVLDFDVMATDVCDDSVMVVCEPPSGSTFPIGTTTVMCTATDAAGNSNGCSFDVTVEDTTPPTINSVTASPSMLWPPNHKWVDVHVSVDAEDTCDATLSCSILDVTSNEPINGLGDGNTEPDWMITGDNSVKLRAERSGNGSSRIYTLRVMCADDSGNSAEATVEVIVPHDQRGKPSGR